MSVTDFRNTRFDRYWCCFWFEKEASAIFLTIYHPVHVVLHFLGLIFWATCAAEFSGPSLFIPGLVMSFASVLMELLIVSPVGRYFSQPSRDNRKIFCFDTKEPIRTSQTVTAVLMGGCAIFTIVSVGCIASWWDSSPSPSADTMRVIHNFSWLFLFVSVYFVVATLLEFGFCGDTFLMIFIYSIVITNCSFAMYYLNPIIGGFISGIGLYSLLTTFVFLTYNSVIILKKETEWNDKSVPEYVQCFVLFACMWQVYAIVMSCLTTSNWNSSDPSIWNIDHKFVASSTERNWFYIFQALPGAIVIAITVVIIFVGAVWWCIISECCSECRGKIRHSINEAKIHSADIRANEVTPIPDVPAKDVPSEISALLERHRPPTSTSIN